MIKEKKLKKVGNVYVSDKYINQCDCGETITMKFFMKFEQGKVDDIKEATGDIFMGFCEGCGNIFHTNLMEIKK